MGMDYWIGKVALVTGVSSGMGYDIAKTLVREGLVVVGVARRADKLQVLKSEASGKGEFHPQQCDITNGGDLKKLFAWIEARLGGLDILINNAGCIGIPKNIGENDTDDWKQILDLNVHASASCVNYALKTMRTRGDNGIIININSLVGHYVPTYLTTYPMSMYVASKHASTALTKCFDEELKGLNSNIRVTSISPGLVKSEMVGGLVETEVIHLQPKEISEAILYIISRDLHVHVRELSIAPIHQLM